MAILGQVPEPSNLALETMVDQEGAQTMSPVMVVAVAAVVVGEEVGVGVEEVEEGAHASNAMKLDTLQGSVPPGEGEGEVEAVDLVVDEVVAHELATNVTKWDTLQGTVPAEEVEAGEMKVSHNFPPSKSTFYCCW